jgi:proteic killer suppression protein
MGDIRTIVWQKSVEKQLNRLPSHVERKFFAWVTSVKLAGIRAVRKGVGFHDEPLKGDRKGQRSVRLSKGYRAIYEERDEFIEVVEVTHHEY